MFAPLALLAVASVMLITAAAAPAIDSDLSHYTITPDEEGANDEPGQKDLTLQGTSNFVSGQINVLWNWDDTSVGGGNTLDACTLFDVDPTGPGLSWPGNADFAFCAIVGNMSKPTRRSS